MYSYELLRHFWLKRGYHPLIASILAHEGWQSEVITRNGERISRRVAK